jgi:methanogenic corrinoid protein MtbC1
VLVGCAPSEQHDLGALMISVFLVRHGWQVIYLGPEVPMKDLLDTIRQLQPDIVCMAASTTETATQLYEIGRAIQGMPPPCPAFGYGGRAYNLNPMLIQRMPGTFLGKDAQEVVDVVAEILSVR